MTKIERDSFFSPESSPPKKIKKSGEMTGKRKISEIGDVQVIPSKILKTAQLISDRLSGKYPSPARSHSTKGGVIKKERRSAFERKSDPRSFHEKLANGDLNSLKIELEDLELSERFYGVYKRQSDRAKTAEQKEDIQRIKLFTFMNRLVGTEVKGYQLYYDDPELYPLGEEAETHPMISFFKDVIDQLRAGEIDANTAINKVYEQAKLIYCPGAEDDLEAPIKIAKVPGQVAVVSETSSFVESHSDEEAASKVIQSTASEQISDSGPVYQKLLQNDLQALKVELENLQESEGYYKNYAEESQRAETRSQKEKVLTKKLFAFIGRLTGTEEADYRLYFYNPAKYPVKMDHEDERINTMVEFGMNVLDGLRDGDYTVEEAIKKCCTHAEVVFSEKERKRDVGPVHQKLLMGELQALEAELRDLERSEGFYWKYAGTAGHKELILNKKLFSFIGRLTGTDESVYNLYFHNSSKYPSFVKHKDDKINSLVEYAIYIVNGLREGEYTADEGIQEVYKKAKSIYNVK